MNTTPDLKQVTVFNGTPYTDDFPSHGNAREFLAWFAGKLASIPEEFQASAQIELEAHMCYDCPEVNVCISYTRHETQNEANTRAREANERAVHEEAQLVRRLDQIRANRP